jgi:transcriptional regulator with XRE-family HTH domain
MSHQHGQPDQENCPHDPSYVQPDALGQILAARRALDGLSLEQVSGITGVSAATLWRWERQRPGKDPRKLHAVARWLGVQLDPNAVPVPLPIDDSIVHQDGQGTMDFVEAHLRADRNLDPKTAAALSRMFRVAYEQFARPGTAESEDIDG